MLVVNRVVRCLPAVLAAVVAGLGSANAAWPDRPIKFVVPFAAGGPVDVAARVVAAPVADQLGAGIVIENRPGAGGNIGISAAARAEPDGTTFLVVSGGFTINPAMYEKVPYDAVKDFVPVAELAISPNLFVATKASGIASIPDLVARAKAEPGKLSYAGPGVGTQSHFAGELLKIRAGIDIAHVSHNGAAPATQSMLSGSIPLGVLGLGPTHEHFKAGTLVALAVASAKRVPELPGMPTMLELGYKDFEIDVTVSLFAPAATPPEIVARMSAEAIKALQRPEVREKMRAGGFEVTALPPDALKAKVAKELVFWREAVELTGIRMK